MTQAQFMLLAMAMLVVVIVAIYEMSGRLYEKRIRQLEDRLTKLRELYMHKREFK